MVFYFRVYCCQCALVILGEFVSFYIVWTIAFCFKLKCSSQWATFYWKWSCSRTTGIEPATSSAKTEKEKAFITFDFC